MSDSSEDSCNDNSEDQNGLTVMEIAELVGLNTDCLHKTPTQRRTSCSNIELNGNVTETNYCSTLLENCNEINLGDEIVFEIPTDHEDNLVSEHETVDIEGSQGQDIVAVHLNQEEFCGDLSSKRKRRKKAFKSGWKKEANKMKRMKGQAYEGFQELKSPDSRAKKKTKQVQNVLRTAKTMKLPCSSASCRKSKLRHCDKFSHSDRLNLFEVFWNSMDWGQKRAYVYSLVDVIPKKCSTTKSISNRTETFVYYLKLQGEKMQVCKTMFINTLGIGLGQINLWVKKGFTSSSQIQQRKKQTSRESKGSPFLKEFFESLPKLPSHYCRSSTSKLYLEPIINSKMHLYTLYKERCTELHQAAVSRWKFNGMFNSMNLSLFLPKKDQCDVCCSYEAGNLSEDRWNSHIQNKNKAREEKHRDKGLSFQGLCHVLTMDVESVKMSPMLKASALYYKTKLMVHNFTVYDLKTRDVTCYLWEETEGDLTASSFASCLRHFIAENYGMDNIPIVIFSDGCTSQNRNAMMSNCLLDLATTQGRVITQKFLEKGHTQMECDSVHSSIEMQLKNQTIYVPTDYIKICEDAREKPCPYRVKYLTHDQFLDFSDKNKQRYTSIRPGTGKGDPCVTDLRMIRYNPSGSISYKLSFDEDAFWKDLPQKSRVISSVDFQPLHKGRIPITKKKYKDLQDLKSVLPSKHHSFYDDIPHTK